MKFHNKISALAGLIFTLVPFISALINYFLPESKDIGIITFAIAWVLLAHFILTLPYKELRKYHIIDTECNKHFGYHLIEYESNDNLLCSVMEIKYSKCGKICCANFIDFGLNLEPYNQNPSNKGFNRFTSDDFQFSGEESCFIRSSLSFETDKGSVIFIFNHKTEKDDGHIVRRIDDDRFSKNVTAISGNSRKFNKTDCVYARILIDDEGKISNHERRRLEKCKLNDGEILCLVKTVMCKESEAVKDKNKSVVTPIPPPEPRSHTHISTLDKAADKGTESKYSSELFDTINEPTDDEK